MASDLEKSLIALKEKYLRSLSDKLAEINSLWGKLKNEANTGDYEVLHRMVHSLAGSGATFGESDISKSAKSLELRLKKMDVSGCAMSATEITEIEKLIKNLEFSASRVNSAEIKRVEQSIIELNAKKSADDGNKIASIKIVVADDDELSRAQLCKLLEAEGHKVLEAENGRQAIELFEKHRPDLMLMDVIMPEVTGYEAAETIKRLSKNHFVPIIFLTAITESEKLAQCIASGGDDFLSKPVNPIILNAKIQAMQRIRVTYEKLDTYQRNTEEELETSKKVFSSLIKTRGEEIDGLHCWATSPGHFSGDTRLFRKLDNGHNYILLCDFTGHGLPAALGTIFVADIFRSMTDKTIPPDIILSEINKKMLQIMPLGRYCAALFIDHDPNTQKMKFWNNGLPAGLIVDKDHRIIHELQSKGLPLGISSEESFVDPFEIDVSSSKALIVFSDGVTEAENSSGEMYTDQRLKQKLNEIPNNQGLFENIKSDIESFMCGWDPVDDISLIVLNFNN